MLKYQKKPIDEDFATISKALVSFDRLARWRSGIASHPITFFFCLTEEKQAYAACKREEKDWTAFR